MEQSGGELVERNPSIASSVASVERRGKYRKLPGYSCKPRIVHAVCWKARGRRLLQDLRKECGIKRREPKVRSGRRSFKRRLRTQVKSGALLASDGETRNQPRRSGGSSQRTRLYNWRK